MAVATSRIAELLGIIERHVDKDKILPLLEELAASETAKRNVSFRETMHRLMEAWLK